MADLQDRPSGAPEGQEASITLAELIESRLGQLPKCEAGGSACHELQRRAHELFGGESSHSLLDDHLNPFPNYPVLVNHEGWVGVVVLNESGEPFAIAYTGYNVMGSTTVSEDPNEANVLYLRGANGTNVMAIGFRNSELAPGFIQSLRKQKIEPFNYKLGELMEFLDDLISIPRFDDPEKARDFAKQAIPSFLAPHFVELEPAQNPFKNAAAVLEARSGYIGIVCCDVEQIPIGVILTSYKLKHDGEIPAEIESADVFLLELEVDRTPPSTLGPAGRVVNLSDYQRGRDCQFTLSPSLSAPRRTGNFQAQLRAEIADQLGILEVTSNVGTLL